jgi:hypothetical protein
MERQVRPSRFHETTRTMPASTAGHPQGDPARPGRCRTGLARSTVSWPSSCITIRRRCACVRPRELLCASLARTPGLPRLCDRQPTFQEAVPNAGYSACHHKITNTDTLIIELREPDPEPATTWIIWPAQPTITEPKRLNISRSRLYGDLGGHPCGMRRSGRNGCKLQIRPWC